MKAEWRSAWTISGVLCVMTPGEALMLLWCVDSWDTYHKVRSTHLPTTVHQSLTKSKVFVLMLFIIHETSGWIVINANFYLRMHELVIYMSNYTLLWTDPDFFGNAYFGAGTGPIHLDIVGCSGSENRLIDCPRSPVVNCTNNHLEDAGVRCHGLWYIVYTVCFHW